MTTTTTVGYGDILPVTDAERMFVTVVMLVGIGFFGYVVGEMTTVFVDAASNGEMLQQRLKEVSPFSAASRGALLLFSPF
jgi:voltage-gated potassium channel